ncbi:hypothetical protein [Flavobacterium sp.]|uniref:hypothetical protein n=1 Tax=Flavobacterium sp. TaxID=239 RepID=UPI00261AD514|nr:hypothetical protein [Flavobacterium sp.]
MEITLTGAAGHFTKTFTYATQFCLLTLVLLCTAKTSAQTYEWEKDEKGSILFGLAQPLSGGFNIEGNYIYKRFIFDYSHGVSLDYKERNVTNSLENQGVAVHIPYTTGFGVGYRFKEWINIRVEPKWHRFEFYYNGETQNESNRITAFNTFTLGIGVYFAYEPFKKQNNYLRGFLIAPSIRFWPTISSTLNNDRFVYFNKLTQRDEKIETFGPGIGFSPLIVNISLGYTFNLKKYKAN